MNNKEFVSELAQRTGLSSKEVMQKIELFSSVLGDRLSESDSLFVYGFGSFEMLSKMERVVTVPISGKKVLVPPKRVVLFRPGITLKETVKNIKIE